MEESDKPTETPSSNARQDAWARPVTKLRFAGAPGKAVNLNVDGRLLTGPLQGFGQLWQKTYQVRLSGATVSPEEVIRVWKAEFPAFWPKGNQFYTSLTGIQPGEVALLNLSGPGGSPSPVACRSSQQV